jgi:membrane-associated protease RseP (regulator of RpoE activity)
VAQDVSAKHPIKTRTNFLNLITNVNLSLIMWKVISYFLIAFLTFSCALQTTSTVNTAYLSQTEIEENLTKELKLDLKIKNVGYKIQKTFVEKCPSKKLDLGLMTISQSDIRNEIGTTLNNITSFGRLADKNINAYKKIVNLNDDTKVTGVIKNSPAEKVGIIFGDEILEINSNKISSRSDLENIYEGIDVKIKTRRNEKIIELNIKNNLICNIEFEAFQTNTPNLTFFRTGNTIFVSENLMNYLKTDDELVMVLTNEFSHYLNDNSTLVAGANRLNQTLQITQILTPWNLSLAGASDFSNDVIKKLGIRYSAEEESYADYMSINLTNLLGYSSDKAKVFWERLVKDKPSDSTIPEFRPVDSKKIRVITYSNDEKLNRFPTKEDYQNFIKKFKI